MAQETIQAVRQAELIAEQKEKEALIQAKETVANAEKEAKDLVSTMTKKSLLNAKKASDAALLEGEQMVKEAGKKAEKEIALLNQLLKQKEEKAIELVISALVS